jgi:hypothetical protein
MQQHVTAGAQVVDDLIARRDVAGLGQALYPREIAGLLAGEMAAARRGIFVEWYARTQFALDPFIQPHVGRGGYMGLWRNLAGRIPKKGRVGFAGFADFMGTQEGLIPRMRVEITTQGGLRAHLERGYLEGQLILTY